MDINIKVQLVEEDRYSQILLADTLDRVIEKRIRDFWRTNGTKPSYIIIDKRSSHFLILNQDRYRTETIGEEKYRGVRLLIDSALPYGTVKVF